MQTTDSQAGSPAAAIPASIIVNALRRTFTGPNGETSITVYPSQTRQVVFAQIVDDTGSNVPAIPIGAAVWLIGALVEAAK